MCKYICQYSDVKEKKTIFVGVSGGVDSSVAAALLCDQGHDVAGVFIRTWQPDWIECTWRDERRDAMRVCAHLGIPFIELDLSDAYKQGVADYMIAEYRAGRTPNPDVMCNREVKFGGFLKWARERGADYVATGHYAQNIFNNKTDQFELTRGVDAAKDQSYFLWTLTQEDLAHVLFPVGHLPKEETRKLAKKYELPTAKKKDSQGICFIGMIDMKEFLGHYIDHAPGDVLNEKGQTIGHHDGALFFTLGERHGFTITEKTTEDKPYYVVAKDIQNNTITVAHDLVRYAQEHDTKSFALVATSWTANAPQEGKEYTAQIRYHGEHKVCVLRNVAAGRAEIILVKPDATIAPGQSVVIYDGDVCLGGGIVA